MQIPYAIFDSGYMSAMVAPPVARTGLPKNLVKNRKTRSMAMFTA